MNWVVTDWYRPEKYYTSSSWHSTWAKDGGGVLLNQAPHNLDLIQWPFGMPKRVQGFCKEGHFHDIEVEDDVTAYFEWENGAAGILITSTGEAPGTNRMEISLEEATIICEKNMLKIGETYTEMGMPEPDYRRESTDYFRKINGTWTELSFEKENHQYEKVLQGFSDECNGKGESIAAGREGRKSLLISNAIYLSSWDKKMIEIPELDSQKELQFEKEFEIALSLKK
ncbi:MAG: Gfo/Idh/MocA family oxidoreductase [Oribacterium sp.]|nr:Gfo/Idh/MocA family oxidoreductase [Oribacterium sp.]